MNREWMYRRFTDDGYISHEFQEGLESFIEFACGQPAFMDRDKIRCPCKKCKNKAFMDQDTARLHLASKGFELNYHVWVFQGERSPNVRSQRPNLAGSSRAARRYSDWMADIKKERRTKGRPPYVTGDTWAHWCAHWDTEPVKGRSEIMKKNRLSEPDGPGTGCGRHRGGSKSAVAYAYEMAREQNVPLQQVVFPTFQRLHYSKSEGSYTSGKAKRIAEEVEFQLADMSQGLPDGVSPTPEDVAEIFVSVAGDPQKNRIFGLGSLNNAQATSSYGDSSSISQLQPKLDEALARLEAERERRIEMERCIAEHKSQIVREREEFERRMQEKLADQEVQFTSKIARTEERLAVQQDMLEQLFRERRPPP